LVDLEIEEESESLEEENEVLSDNKPIAVPY
jgi:hypothetical protein